MNTCGAQYIFSEHEGETSILSRIDLVFQPYSLLDDKRHVSDEYVTVGSFDLHSFT